MNIEQAAQVCHEANRAYCQTIGDNSQVPWDLAPQWQRDSAVKGVQYLIDHPYSGPHMQHESWLKEKLDAGWKWGPVKDADKKEHPCILPYHELPLAQRFKDSLFIRVAQSFMGY